jgi:hypothetical protein
MEAGDKAGPQASATKYASASDREKLLTRLLAEHGGDREADAAIPFDRDSLGTTSQHSSAEGDDSREGEALENSLYFASDLQSGQPPIISYAEDGSNGRGRMSATILAQSSPEAHSLHNSSRTEEDAIYDNAGDTDSLEGGPYEYRAPSARQAGSARPHAASARKAASSSSSSGRGGPSSSGDRYHRVPVFSESSALDRTGRFAAPRRSASPPKVPSSQSKARPPSAAAAGEPVAAAAGDEGAQGGRAPPVRYQKTAAELRREAEAKFRAEHPFAPSVPQYQSNRVVGSKGSQWLPVSKTGRGRQDAIIDRIENIRQIHENSLKKRELDRKEMEKALMKDCTFKPELSKGSEKIVSKQLRDSNAFSRSRSRSKSPDCSSSSVLIASSEPPLPPGSGPEAASDRLHREAWARKVDQEERARRIKEINDRQHPFQPELNRTSESIVRRSSSDYKPVHERLGEIQRSRNASREEKLIELVSRIMIH